MLQHLSLELTIIHISSPLLSSILCKAFPHRQTSSTNLVSFHFYVLYSKYRKILRTHWSCESMKKRLKIVGRGSWETKAKNQADLWLSIFPQSFLSSHSLTHSSHHLTSKLFLTQNKPMRVNFSSHHSWSFQFICFWKKTLWTLLDTNDVHKKWIAQVQWSFDGSMIQFEKFLCDNLTREK